MTSAGKGWAKPYKMEYCGLPEALAPICTPLTTVEGSFQADKDFWANACKAIPMTTAFALTSLLQFLWLPFALLFNLIHEGINKSLSFAWRWTLRNSPTREVQGEIVPDAKLKELRNIMRKRDVVQVGGVGPTPLAANFHEQRKLKSQAQQLAQQQKFHKGRKR